MPSADEIFGAMIARAAQVAGQSWNSAKDATSIAFRSMAEQLVLIVQGHVAGEISAQQAKKHVEDIRLQAIAVLAMNTMIGEAAAEQMVNGALTSVSGVINHAIGIDLLI